MSHALRTISLGDLVARFPAVIMTLEQFQLDYCCGGRRTLDEACSRAGLDAESIAEDLQEVINTSAQEVMARCDATQLTPAELCDHIVLTHHTFLREQFPRLDRLAEKVASAHGDRHPELRMVLDAFRELQRELVSHMQKEEQILFPAIRQLSTSETPAEFPFGTVNNPIRVMEHEHDETGHLMKRLRLLTAEYRLPPDACATWKQLWAGLQKLEQDLHVHIHKENYILFPAAELMELATA